MDGWLDEWIEQMSSQIDGRQIGQIDRQAQMDRKVSGQIGKDKEKYLPSRPRRTPKPCPHSHPPMTIPTSSHVSCVYICNSVKSPSSLFPDHCLYHQILKLHILHPLCSSRPSSRQVFLFICKQNYVPFSCSLILCKYFYQGNEHTLHIHLQL